MRIVHFTGAFFPVLGGATAVVHNLAVEQARAGHEVCVLNSWSLGKCRFRHRVRLPYRLISLPPRLNLGEIFRRPWRRRMLSAWLSHLQRRFRFDAWHLHYAYPVGSALPLLQGMGIEPVLTCHGIDVNVVPSIGYGYRLVPELDREITGVLRRCRKLAAISSDMRRSFLDAGCLTDQVFDIPNGVSFDHMNSIPHEVAAKNVRSRYGIPAETSLILTVGRNHPVKGYDLIPGIIAQLARAPRDFVWILVGPNCEPVAAEVGRCGLDRHLKLLGPLGMKNRVNRALPCFPSSELVEVIRASDVVVSLSMMESFSLVVLEAMAAGVAVVSTSVPAVHDLVENGVHGFLVPRGDGQAMAGRIGFLLSDPRARAEMGAQGQQKTRDYDWRLVAEKYVDLYARPVPSCS